MKKRTLYTLLFGVPGFVVALLAALVVSGAGAGLLWLFVFGDNPWPESSGPLLTTLFTVTFAGVWLAALSAGFATGRRLETQPGFNRAHLWLALAATLLPLALLVLQQLRVGNLGPKTEGERCSAYCLELGYHGSGTPPRTEAERTCSCYDEQGREALKLPIDELPEPGN